VDGLDLNKRRLEQGKKKFYFAKQITHNKHTLQVTMAGGQKKAFAHQSGRLVHLSHQNTENYKRMM